MYNYDSICACLGGMCDGKRGNDKRGSKSKSFDYER